MLPAIYDPFYTKPGSWYIGINTKVTMLPEGKKRSLPSCSYQLQDAPEGFGDLDNRRLFAADGAVLRSEWT